MVESLRELNQICQKSRYKEVGNWMARHVVRDAALPVTWLLLHTPITANQVTLISLLVGVFGIVTLAFFPAWCFLLGAVGLQVWYLLDHVDGQIARYRKAVSLSGRFFDFMTHHLIHGCLFFSLGVYAFRLTGSLVFILWGFVASMGILVFNLVHDTKYKTFFERLMTQSRVTVKGGEVKTNFGEAGTARPFFRKLYSWAHKVCEIHVVMNVLTGAACLTFFFSALPDLRLTLLVVYGITTPVLAATKVYYLIATRRIDDEFKVSFLEYEEQACRH